MTQHKINLDPAKPHDDASAEDDEWALRMADASIEYDDEDGSEPGEECGRWDNGSLVRSCAKAGTEECDFECPYRV